MNKPREFWIEVNEYAEEDSAGDACVWKYNPDCLYDNLKTPIIHVIEKKAYDELKTENVNLYSNLNSMGDSLIILTQQRDNALKMLEEMAETLEFYESCHICSRCNPALKSKALEKYRKFKEEMK